MPGFNAKTLLVLKNKKHLCFISVKLYHHCFSKLYQFTDFKNSMLNQRMIPGTISIKHLRETLELRENFSTELQQNQRKTQF